MARIPTTCLLADAYRRAAKRFGARIVQEREFKDTGGARQTDSGVVQTQQQMPVFTQGLPDYDVLVAADENEVFANYLPFRTWDARPVVGSAGLRPVSWDPASKSWGGTQLQDRFVRMAHRRMTALDMQAWTACRMIGEAASRTASTDPAKIIQDMKSADFGVAAYKGQKLSLARLGLAASATHSAVGRPHSGVDLAAAGLSASGDRARHSWVRPARNEVQAMMKWFLLGLCLAAHPEFGPGLYRLCHQRTRQHAERCRSRSDEDGKDRAGRPAAARHHHDQGRQSDPGLRQ